MNISYNWLKDLVEINLNPQEVAEKLTSVGLAVEGIHAHEGDFVFDVDLTSNRGDCLSHLGVARELAAITNSKLRITNYEIQKPKTENQDFIAIEDPDICHRFTARIIRNVKIAPSPKWLVDRLEAIGQRSISNVADVTNYVMHELGNPMHSFDYNKLAGNRIIVRRAKSGEKMSTLDEVERSFTEDMLLICDAEKPVAVAGIMGGQHSGISDETTDVLLEVAYFKRESIRETSRKLKLNTEASHHFERGVDIENLIRASNRATELICELAGGTAEEFVDIYPTEFEQNAIVFKGTEVLGQIVEEVNKLTGLVTNCDEIERILLALGFDIAICAAGLNSKTEIIAPTWRHDVAIKQDLVEEIARHIGYDKIGSELPPTRLAGEFQHGESQKKSLRNALIAQGFDEAISYSFVRPEQDEKFEFVPDLVNEDSEEKFVTLNDSIIEGAVRMRSTLLFGLIESVRHNFNFGQRDVKLFEIGKVFAQTKDSELPLERELFSLILTGGEVLEGKAMISHELDFYDVKGALEAAISAMNLPELNFKSAKIKHLREGNSAEVLFQGKKVGTIGRLADSINNEYKFKQPVYVAEIDIQSLLASSKAKVFYQPLPKFPAIVRDISLLVKRNVEFADLRQAVAEQRVELCQIVEFVDVYEGKGVADDERSITLRFQFRSDKETLREESVEEKTSMIIKNLENKFSAKQRF